MPLAQRWLEEFEEQAPITRKFLERTPAGQLDWRPHPRSMTLGQLALHIARVPAGVVRAAQQDALQLPDFSNPPQPASHKEILDVFDEGVGVVRSLLPGFDDARLEGALRLVQGERELTRWRRGEFLRNVMLNHWYQHRGQLSVYLRLLNVPVPACWGPSADESPNFPPPKV